MQRSFILKRIFLYTYLILLVLATSNCQNINNTKESNRNKKIINSIENQNIIESEKFMIPYNLELPEQKYKLPGCLDEISGLSYYK